MAEGGRWIQKSVEKMRRKGTVGAFGPATKSKIAAGKRKGGLAKKRAIWAENVQKGRKRHDGRSRGRS